MLVGMRVAPMTRESIEAVCAIETVSFLYPWSKSCFLDELSVCNSHHFVLQSENPCHGHLIIAYLFSREIVDELHILKLAVHPEYRRRGVGTVFLNHCLSDPGLTHIASVILDVRESNAAALGLYQKLGFEMAGKRPNYYLDTGEDAFLLQKSFKGVIKGVGN